MRCGVVCDIEELVLLLSFELSEVCLTCELGYQRKETLNNLILVAENIEQSFCSINGDVMYVLYVSVSFAAGDLYMRNNSHATS